MPLMKNVCLLILCLTGLVISAQTPTPQWNWAVSAGGSCEDDLVNNPSAICLDSAGNIYTLVGSNSASITFGAYTFTNPNPATPNAQGYTLSYFVKYNPQGTVLWAKQYLDASDGEVVPGPNSMVVMPGGDAYLHFTMPYDSIAIGGKVAYDSSISIYNQGYCIAHYDPNGNVIALHVHNKPNGGWNAIIPVSGNRMLAQLFDGPDTLAGIAVGAGSVLALLDTAGNVLKAITLGKDSLTPVNYQGVINSGEIAVNDSSIYLIMSVNAYTVLNRSGLPYQLTATSGNLLVKLDTGLNFKWAKPLSGYFGGMLTTDVYDNVYLPLVAASNDTLSVDSIVMPLGHRYLDHLYGYLGLLKLDRNGAAQWIDTFVITLEDNPGTTFAVCADRLGNSYVFGRYNGPFIIGNYNLANEGNIFVTKINPTGTIQWVQTSQNLQGNVGYVYNSMAEDGHGNIYIGGQFYRSTHPFFGNDSLVWHTPIANYPLANDIFFTRLGNCNPLPPSLSATSPLSWCGNDSVTLTASTSNTYLWNTGDTTRSVTVSQSGTYAVYGVDTLGCYAQSQPDTITTYPQPVLNLQVNNVLCKGDSTGQLHLATTDATGSVYYGFNPPVADTLKLPAATYIVTATDSVGCAVTDTATVTQPDGSLTLLVNYYPPVKDITGIVIATASGGTPGYNFNWQPGSSNTDTLKNPSPGLYIVTVLDSNGCSATDSLVVPVIINGIQQIAAPVNISIYPNPSAGVFYIETPVGGEMRVYDELGQVVLQQIIAPGKGRIGTVTLARGTYVVEVVSAGSKYDGKLVIE